jgi:hypothetical protein
VLQSFPSIYFEDSRQIVNQGKQLQTISVVGYQHHSKRNTAAKYDIILLVHSWVPLNKYNWFTIYDYDWLCNIVT